MGLSGYRILCLQADTAHEDFKYFIDTCHKNGLGVILTRFGISEGWARTGPITEQPSTNMRISVKASGMGNPCFYYGRTEVRNFLIANAVYWFDNIILTVWLIRHPCFILISIANREACRINTAAEESGCGRTNKKP